MKFAGWIIEERNSDDSRSKWEAFPETARKTRSECIRAYEQENPFYTGVKLNYKMIRSAGNARIIKFYILAIALLLMGCKEEVSDFGVVEAYTIATIPSNTWQWGYSSGFSGVVHNSYQVVTSKGAMIVERYEITSVMKVGDSVFFDPHVPEIVYISEAQYELIEILYLNDSL